MNYLQRKKLAFMSIVNSVKGFVRTVLGMPPLTLPDCVDTESVINYKIEGNSVQNGTPTPEAPVEVQSVGDLVTDITDANYGKYKIPVVAKGKNMLKDVRDIYNGGGSHVANRYAEVIEDGRECISFTSANTIVYDKIKFKENTQYTFSFDCKDFVYEPSYTGTHDVPFGIWYTDGSRKYTSIACDAGWKKITLTSEANKTISYIGMGIYIYIHKCFPMITSHTYIRYCFVSFRC